MQPRLVVEQKITVFTNQYRIFAANTEGGKAQMVSFVQQKRLAFKEKVSFYTDESKQQLAFTFRAEKVLDVHGRYFVEDANGQPVGAFQKQFGKSLINSTWNILDANGNQKILVNESNQFIAIFRRIAGLIPYVGNLLELVAVLFRYHFKFVDVSSGEEIGRYQKTTLIRDHYLLSMTDAGYQSNDWRVLAAVAVALDALQSR
ncbi:MAG TPA: hypothetical protein VFW90_04055 [Candidatus Saccharimonadales bacterium]|nr:hypothetical protein [Candidatus Saccharimonadales bacterium]